MPIKILLYIFTLMTLLINEGCALFGGGEPTHPKAKNYSYKKPSDWENADRGGSDHAFQLPSGAKVLVSSDCQNSGETSLEVLTRHFLFGMREIRWMKKEKIQLHGRPALRSQVTGKYEGKKFELEIIVLSVADCIYDFSLIHPGKIEDADRDSFYQFIKSFTLDEK